MKIARRIKAAEYQRMKQSLIPSLRASIYFMSVFFLTLVGLSSAIGTVTQVPQGPSTPLSTTTHSKGKISIHANVQPTTTSTTNAATVTKDIARRAQSSSPAVTPQDTQNNYNATSGNNSKSVVKVVCLVAIALSSVGLLIWLLATVCTGDKDVQSIDEWSEQSSWYSIARWTTGRRQETPRIVGSRKDDTDLEAADSETYITKKHILPVSNIVQKQSTHTHGASRQAEGRLDEWSKGSYLFNAERKTDRPLCQEVQNSAAQHERGQQENKEKQEGNNSQLPRTLSLQEESMAFTPILYKNAADKPHTARGTVFYLEGKTTRKEKAQTDDLKGDMRRMISSSTSSNDDSFALSTGSSLFSSDQDKVCAIRGRVALEKKNEDASVFDKHSFVPLSTVTIGMGVPVGSLVTNTARSQEKDAKALSCSSNGLTYQVKQNTAVGKYTSDEEQELLAENSKKVSLETNDGADDELAQSADNLKVMANYSRKLRKEKPTELKGGTNNKGDSYTPFIRRRGPLIVGQHVESKDVCWVASLKGSRIYIAVAMALEDLSKVDLPRPMSHTRFNTMGMSILTGHFDTDLDTTLKTHNCYQYKNNDPVDYISSFVRDLREKAGLNGGEGSTKPLKSSPLFVCRMCISLLIGRLKVEYSDDGISEKTCVLSPAAALNKKKSLRSRHHHNWYMRDIREAARVLFKEEQFEAALGDEQRSLNSEANEDRIEKQDEVSLEWDGFKWRESRQGSGTR